MRLEAGMDAGMPSVKALEAINLLFPQSDRNASLFPFQRENGLSSSQDEDAFHVEK